MGREGREGNFTASRGSRNAFSESVYLELTYKNTLTFISATKNFNAGPEL